MGHLIVNTLIAITALLFVPEGFAMRSMDYLETQDLSELSYIHMESCECGSRRVTLATILDAEDLPHLVRVGDYIGKDNGQITQITPNSIEVTEVYEVKAGEWVERPAILPKVHNTGARSRFGYEQERALHLLGEIDATGKQLRALLAQCKQLFGKAAKRLACFDEAVGTLLP